MQEKQTRDDRRRIWPSLDEETYGDLESIAESEDRKVHEMAAILIKSAIKERKRKRKNGKEGSVSDNS